MTAWISARCWSSIISSAKDPPRDPPWLAKELVLGSLNSVLLSNDGEELYDAAWLSLEPLSLLPPNPNHDIIDQVLGGEIRIL